MDGLDSAARERFFDTGYPQVANLAERIEAQTGAVLESRRALDYGCGVGRMTLPLAQRCERVYGLDVSPATLHEADLNAKRQNITNVEWMDADRLGELSGRYDLVLSFFVFQHIPSREGERIFATILEGLRPGGVGAIQFTLRPRFRDFDRSHLYMLTNSYSLDRLGRLFVHAGVTEWHAKLHPTAAGEDQGNGSHYDSATLVFRKS